MSWIGGSQGNPQVLPMERSHMLGKLQGFLVDYLGSAPDVAGRANEMAVKFEEHIFLTTKTREEYVQTIQARMKLVAAKKGNADVPPSEAKDLQQQQGDSYQLSDSEQSSFMAKMEQFRGLIPRMEKLIEMHGRLGTDPEMIRKYAGFKNVIQRQLELLPSNTFIMPISVINSIFEQSTKMTVYLATKAKELLASVSAGQLALGSSRSGEQLPKQRLSASEILQRVSSKDSMLVEKYAAPAFKAEPDLKLLQYEIDALSKGHNQIFTVERKEDGIIIVHARVSQGDVRFKIPQDYPGSSPVQIATGADFVDPRTAIHAPVTFSTTFKLYISNNS